MTLKEFQLALKNELVRRGVPERVADSKTLWLVKTFSEDDLKEVDSYKSPSDFAAISESLIEIIMTAEDESAAMKAGTIEFHMPTNDEESTKEQNSSTTEVLLPKDGEIYLSEDAEDIADPGEKVRVSPLFVVLAALTSPAWIAIAALIVLFFGAVFIAIFSIIAALILFAIALVCGGVIVLIVGLIYGGSLIAGGSVGVGLFEMGIGFVSLGLGIALAVLSYNLSIRVIPYVVKHVASFWRYMWQKIGALISRIVERCSQV